eukprot:5438444-Alexandrium_andersonii.AAC.1
MARGRTGPSCPPSCAEGADGLVAPAPVQLEVVLNAQAPEGAPIALCVTAGELDAELGAVDEVRDGRDPPREVQLLVVAGEHREAVHGTREAQGP